MTNKVACENSKPGLDPSEWQIDGSGDESIQGYATAMSVDLGQTINFKIKTPASKYHINILRLGYYDGDGARMIKEDLLPSAKLPQTQPACQTFEATGLIDCGKWSVSASWTVPSTAVSGLYMAHLIRDDTGEESQIFFVVRDDASHADVVVKTSDSTWQAYNEYGGNTLYSCNVACPDGDPEGYKAAYAVSYNRPFDGTLPRDGGFSDPFYAEYQLIRFLERNGYDLSYISQHDAEASPALLKNHKVFISSGHDEYWSKGERQGVEAARDAGVNLAFFSGNELFWKTRWENSSDGSNTPYRTLVSYKDTHFDQPEDPAGPSTTTGTWRDPRFSPPGDAGKPENNLTGQLFMVNSGTSEIHVPGTFSQLRFWRNTKVSKLTPTQTLTLAPGTGTLGYEWDVDPDNGFRPTGRFSLSSTTVSGVETFTDYGTAVEQPTTATHSLSLYRAPSGALVFGAGTVQWSWGLDVTNAWHKSGPDGFEPDPTMQQATVNLLADMGSQPATLQSGLVATSKSTDSTAPSATVSSPSNGAALTDGKAVTISGTASDSGGVVAGVEVSTDNGATWHPASGTSSWTYTWSPHGSPATTIKARAIDDSGNIGAASSGTSVSIACPCSIFGATAPATADAGDNGSVELGMKFRSDTAGTIDGIRFYKSAANTGTHVGGLWTEGGTLLAEGNFSGESATGWQQMKFSSPVPIQANTIYVAGYLAPKGHYSASPWTVNHPPAVGPDNLDSPPLHVIPDSASGNGLYEYASSSSFPTNAFQATNYWVDVLFTPAPVQALPGQVTGVSASAGAGSATVSWSPPTSGGTPTSYRVTPYIGATAQTPVTVSVPTTSKTITGLTAGTAYTFKVAAINAVGTGPDSSASNSVTPTAKTAPGAPTGISASPGPAQATVNWTAPASDGGSPITGYRVTPYLAGIIPQTPTTAGAGATTATVSGLTNGTAYTFKVAAINSVGTGPDSAASNSVTPAPVNPPGAPTALTGVAKSAGAQLSWTAPTSNGGSAITGYRVTPYIGAVAQTPTATGSTATTATIGGLSNGTTYTFKVAAINIAGAGAESTASAALTPNATIFDLAAPATVDAGDPDAVELGVKFQSDTAGIINGVRFYKAATNTGTHVGSLWSATGTLLAQANFANETASGWQQVTFSAPVSIQANTTYVAGYYAPKGHYSVNGPTLATAVDNPPLHALSNASSENGVYAYGASPTFPTNTWQASNYWVDVLFAPPAAATAPGAPTGVSATAGLAQATVNWTAPASNGGAPITSYRVTPYIGATAQTPVTVSAPATSKTITGLTAGTAYTFKVAAINSVGTGPDSSASNSVTPTAATAPGAPTGISASAGVAQATVNWTAPASDGGSPITGYRVTPYIGSTAQTPSTAGAGASSTTVTGLTNGTAYTFKVAAINAVGTGADSAASNSVTPAALNPPGAPTALTGVAKSAGAQLSWTAPVNNGGGAITSYRITPYIGASAQTPTTTGSTATTATINGLTNGTAYTFTVAAINSAGAGPESAASAALTPNATIFDLATPATVDAGDPDAVELGVKFQSDTAGEINGIRFYKAAANTGTHVGSLWNAAGTLLAQATFANESASGWQQVNFSAPVTITANTTYVAGYLAPKGHYSVNGPNFATAVDNPPLHALSDAAATNGVFAYGSSPTFPTNSWQGSNYWVDVLFAPPAAATAPGAPTGVSASAGLGQATVNWTAPANNGGAAITSYRITPYLGATAQTPVTVSAPASSKTITGLTPGSAYTFKVAAINSVGTGPDSSASNSVTPTAATAPVAPTGISASAGVAQAIVNWTAPASDGGSPITGYRVTPYIGSTVQTPTTAGAGASSTTVTGLANGTTYTFKVEAINAVGTGPASAASNAVTPSAAGVVPDAPTAVSAAARDQSAIVNWTAPASDGGSPITGYRVTPFIDATAQTPSTAGAGASSTTVTGLTNGTAYTFKVEAINNVGSSVASAATAATTPRATLFEQTVPAIADVAEPDSVVLGVKFNSDSAGKILGIRFYKSAANTGPHVVSLWSSTGTLLAQATSAGETASGWQEVAFASPVTIAANTTYVAAYLAPNGHYAVDSAALFWGFDNPPLHALPDGGSGNGVFAYSSTSTFPSGSYQATNYWVDVLFTP